MEFYMEELKVKYFSDAIDELCYVEGKSDWIDLHVRRRGIAESRANSGLIPLGVGHRPAGGI